MNSSSHNPFAAKDFSPKTRKALTTQGIAVVGCMVTPAGDTLYTLNDNGLGKVRTFTEVLALA